MSLSSSFKTNETREVEGAIVSYGEAVPAKKDADGNVIEPAKETTFRISRMSRSNKKYAKALDKLTRPHRRQIELDTLSVNVADEVSLNVFVSTILLGWDNVLASDVTGNKEDTGFAPFTEANAKLLMKNLPDLYEDLLDKARKAAIFRDEAIETEAGN